MRVPNLPEFVVSFLGLFGWGWVWLRGDGVKVRVRKLGRKKIRFYY